MLAGVGLAVDATVLFWVYCWVSFLVLLWWFESRVDQTSDWEGLGVVGVWRDSCVGRCLGVAMVVLPLGGVRIVSAVALAGVPMGSCVVFISGIRSG